MPEALYDFTELTGMDDSSGLVRTYTSSDMNGATIIGVRILPLLNPNPSTTSRAGCPVSRATARARGA